MIRGFSSGSSMSSSEFKRESKTAVSPRARPRDWNRSSPVFIYRQSHDRQVMGGVPGNPNDPYQGWQQYRDKWRQHHREHARKERRYENRY
jgi:hypothetical protein